jgi:UPF0716 protein FxsA
MLSREVPPRLLFHGALLAAAALFFLIPGLLTELFAALLFTPLVRTMLFRNFGGAFSAGVEAERSRRAGRAPRKAAPRDPNVIEGEFTRLDAQDK